MPSVINKLRIIIFSLFLFCFHDGYSQQGMLASTEATDPGDYKSQLGSIMGVIRDNKTKETIIGANVVIEGSTVGVSTNLDGQFEIGNLQPGKYNIVVSFVSYKPQRFEGVLVSRNKATMLEISLDENIMMLEGVQVSARRATNTDVSMLSAIRKSEIVVSGISAQQISKSQDNDAAMVIKRIPGVTVVDGRFIMIRGLSERYNPVMLHNVFAPSMEADVRSFSFDIIPASLVDQILIYKSPSAELPGEFGGGVVKIFTRNVPDENSLQATYTTSFEPGSSFEDFSRQKTSRLAWLGFNNKQNNLPEDFPENLRSIKNQQELVEVGRSLQNNWVPLQSNAGLNHSALVTGALRFKVGKIQIGNITSLSYSNSKSIDNVKRKDYNLYDQVQQVSSLIFSFNDQQNNQHVRTGVLHNWAMNIGTNHNIEFKNLFNQINKTQYVYRTGPHIEFGYYADNHSFYQIFRGVYAGQLAGQHKVMNESTTIDWVAGYGYSFREEPDYRRYRSDRDTVENTLTLYVPFGAAASYFMGRFYSEMSEENYTAALNIKYKFRNSGIGAFKPELSMGLFYEDKDRYFTARNLGYVRASTYQFNQNLLNVTIDSLFHTDNINSTTGIIIDEQTNPSDSYTAGNKLLAYYIQTLLPFTYRLKFVGGLRIEENHQHFNSYTLTNNPVNVDNPIVSYLPSAYLSYNFTDKSLVRFAYGKTVNRPEFRELAPFGFYDFNYNLVKKGNEYLKTAKIHHFDLRWEYYPSPSEIVLVGFFVKRFIGPIESSFIPGGGTAGIKTFTYNNADAADSKGVEVEVRKSLAGLAGINLFESITLLFNASFIQSNVELGVAGIGQKFKQRPMQGQSPYIVNLGLYYHQIEKKLHVNLLYNVIGKRIFMIGYDDYPDIYEMPRNLLDITFTKGFGKNLELKAGIRDILNQEHLLLQDGNQDGIFDSKNDQVIERFSPGRNFSLGLTWKI